MQSDGIDLLDRCLADIQAGRKTLAECLAENAGDPELHALLPIAATVTAPAIAPDAARKRAARHAFVAALDREANRGRWAWALPGFLLPAPQWRVALAVACALFLLIGVGGAANVAAQAAQPGDPLYGLKTAIEQVQVAAAVRPENRAQVRLEIAAKRLTEVDKALDAGRIEVAQVAAASYATAMSDAARDIQSAPPNPTRHAALREEIQEYVERERAVSAKARARGAESTQAVLEQGKEVVVTTIERIEIPLSPTPGRGADAPRAPVARSPTGPSPARAATAPRTALPMPTRSQPANGGVNGVRPPAGRGDDYRELRAHLDAAREALSRGQTAVALAQLNAFGNQLNAMYRAGHLTAEEFASLEASYAELMLRLATAAATASRPGTAIIEGAPPASPSASATGTPSARLAEPTATPEPRRGAVTPVDNGRRGPDAEEPTRGPQATVDANERGREPTPVETPRPTPDERGRGREPTTEERGRNGDGSSGRRGGPDDPDPTPARRIVGGTPTVAPRAPAATRTATPAAERRSGRGEPQAGRGEERGPRSNDGRDEDRSETSPVQRAPPSNPTGGRDDDRGGRDDDGDDRRDSSRSNRGRN